VIYSLARSRSEDPVFLTRSHDQMSRSLTRPDRAARSADARERS
jgi:hypothetical protein